MPRKKYKTVEEYFADFPKETQVKLEQIRQAVKEVAPEAQEAISYQMPSFKLDGNLVWYAAFKDHIGFFPRETGVAAFKDKLAGYHVSKGTIQFLIDKPIPIALIKEIVKYRIKENQSEKATYKVKTKSAKV